MADTKWGVKRVCGECAIPFYDMSKPKAICPKCGSMWDESQFLASVIAQDNEIRVKPKQMNSVEIETELQQPMTKNLVDELYGDILEDDFSESELKDVSEMFEESYAYRD